MVDSSPPSPFTPNSSPFLPMQSCIEAFRNSSISITNVISCAPGTEALTSKSNIVQTLSDMFGSAAAGIMPTAFLLPAQYPQFARHLRQTNHAGIWALKEEAHRGMGVVPLTGDVVLKRALEHAPWSTQDPHSPPKHRFVVAQRFIDDQLLINGRPFTMRLWMVVAGGGPVVRAYLYNGGITPFGGEVVQEDAPRQRRAESMVVNIFQQDRSKAMNPLSLRELERHFHNITGSDAAFQRGWDVVERATAATLAATLPTVRQMIHWRLPHFQSGTLELMGLDFVWDTKLRPWLVEVNRLPSMARKVMNCTMPGDVSGANGDQTVDVCGNNAMDTEKAALLEGLLRTLAARKEKLERHAQQAHAAVAHREKGGARACGVTVEVLRQVLDARVEAEAGASNGFIDLTPKVYRALRCMAGSKKACAVLPQLPDGTCPSASGHSAALAAVKQVQSWIGKLPFLLDVSPHGNKAAATNRPPYVPFQMDAVMDAWFRLPESERRLTPAALLGQLCTLESRVVV